MEGTKAGSRAAFKHGDRNNSGERGGHRSRDRGTGSVTVDPIDIGQYLLWEGAEKLIASISIAE